MSTSTVETLFNDYTANIGTVLADNLDTALIIGASLFGILLLVRLAKRLIAAR